MTQGYKFGLLVIVFLPQIPPKMTDEYVLDRLIEMELKFYLNQDTGCYEADALNEVALYLKGSSESRISLTFVLGRRKKYTITEPPCPIWKRGKDIPLVKQKLEALLKQAEVQCGGRNFESREEETRNEILNAAIGWNRG
ncbi:MAG: hypothetical protein A2750_02220 [Candidatus Yanofskybacteria bacterium RIFCSPHIGHO2_01_FULL_45_42]|uniref:Uncharacterized protein n=2 Tax=Candidatus Yanofskyibacteriota TaxID=1752733 RepID=A0A1F8FJH4_9BACT|nr:MAG: hypothetical protein A2750_02220 [Candidatus Yanofskybacteria bacterium RIFCSPHIGHO2_01_FULL_45_42]OGN12880.1 MAG: hypothetical protein A3J47_00010 [Candidatus Yanofskybacteria bacterium RIFCSPHIGHO2_02_FULL_43_22]